MPPSPGGGDASRSWHGCAVRRVGDRPPTGGGHSETEEDMTHSGACPNCLRRSWLLSLAAPYIEKLHSATLHRSVPEVLRLGNEDIVKAVAPKVASTLLARVDALPECHFYEELQATSCWATCPHDSLYPESLRGTADAPFGADRAW
jgi:hypothetical protein